MKGTEIHYRVINDIQHDFSLWQARLRDEMPEADPEHGNPLLWWARYLRPGEQDWVACGTKLKRDAVQAIDEYVTEFLLL